MLMLPLHRFPTGAEPPPIPDATGGDRMRDPHRGDRGDSVDRGAAATARPGAWSRTRIRAWNRPGRAHPPCRRAPSPWPCGAEPGAANLPGSGADRVTAPGSGLRLRAAARHDRLKLLCLHPAAEGAAATLNPFGPGPAAAGPPPGTRHSLHTRTHTRAPAGTHAHTHAHSCTHEPEPTANCSQTAQPACSGDPGGSGRTSTHACTQTHTHTHTH